MTIARQGWLKSARIFDKDVSITDIIISLPVNQGYRYGEFEKADNTLAVESEDKLVERMLGHIRILAAIASATHYKNNFDATRTILKTKKHHITRLSTHEFTFYPSKQRGPLSVGGFNKLIQQLKDMAAKLPPNLHLNLGTFPVEENGDVYNLLVYVQCGSAPVVTAVAKSIPYSEDPYYPGKKNKFYSAGSEGREWKRQIEKKYEDLCECENAETYTPAKLDAALAEYADLCKQNPDFGWNKSLQPDASLSLVLDRVDTLRNSMKSGVEQPISMLAKAHQQFCEMIGKQSSTWATDAMDFLKDHYLPIKKLGDCEDIYNGSLVCKTVGGISFLLLFEICYEHYLGVALRRFLALFDAARKQCDGPFPILISHIIVANSVNLIKSKLVGGQALMADFYDAAVMHKEAPVGKFLEMPDPDSKHKIPAAKFAGPFKVMQFAPRLIQALDGGLRKQVNEYNDFVRQRKARLLLLGVNEVPKAKLLAELDYLDLIWAIDRDDFDKVYGLLKSGINPAEPLLLGCSPLDRAVDKERWAMVGHMIANLPFHRISHASLQKLKQNAPDIFKLYEASLQKEDAVSRSRHRALFFKKDNALGYLYEQMDLGRLKIV